MEHFPCQVVVFNTMCHTPSSAPESNKRCSSVLSRSLGIAVLLLGVFFFLPTHHQAQTKIYGINYGMGKTTQSLPDEEPVFVSPIGGDNEDFLQIGLDYMYAPRNTPIFFKSGLLYNARSSESTALDYLKAPVGIDIGLGNTFQFIFGANVYTSILLAHTGFDDQPDFIENKRRFQFGWGGNFGFGIDISEKVNFNLLYQRFFDITEMYSVETVNKEGSQTENFLGQDGFVRMGLQYRILNP